MIFKFGGHIFGVQKGAHLTLCVNSYVARLQLVIRNLRSYVDWEGQPRTIAPCGNEANPGSSLPLSGTLVINFLQCLYPTGLAR